MHNLSIEKRSATLRTVQNFMNVEDCDRTGNIFAK